MSVATEKYTEVEGQFFDFLSRMEEPVVKGVKELAGKVEGRLPEVTVPGLGDKVPTATEVVEAYFGFWGRLLENQKEFAEALLESGTPVRAKFVAPAPVKPLAAAKATPKVKAA